MTNAAAFADDADRLDGVNGVSTSENNYQSSPLRATANVIPGMLCMQLLLERSFS